MKRRWMTMVLFVFLLAGDARADWIDDLAAEIKSGDPGRQLDALTQVMRRGEGGERVALAVAPALKSKNSRIRMTTVMAFGVLGLPETGKVLDLMWKDSSWLVRAAVLRTAESHFQRSGGKEKLVPWLTKGLEDRSWFVRRQAAMLVLDFEEFPKEMAAPLTKALEARDKKLAKKDPELVQSLREKVTACLAKAREHAAPAVKALTDVLEDDSAVVRANAATALGNVGGEKVATAEPLLVDMLKAKVTDVRRAAAYALSSFDPAKVSTARALAKLLKDDDAKTCLHAAAAIGRMGEAGSSAVGALVRALGSKDPELRAAAATACGQVGPKAKSAVSQLSKLADKDEQESVRAAATEALKAIREE